jgi:hypothetical protein
MGRKLASAYCRLQSKLKLESPQKSEMLGTANRIPRLARRSSAYTYLVMNTRIRSCLPRWYASELVSVKTGNGNGGGFSAASTYRTPPPRAALRTPG